MAHPKHLSLIKQGVEGWNKWRSEYPEISPDLSEAALQGADLRGINLKDARLEKVNLTGANMGSLEVEPGSNDLILSDLRGADLRDADLNEVDLMGANLSKANLHGSNLIDSEVSLANFNEANLSDADLSGIRAVTANFSGANLRRATIEVCTLGQSNLSDADLTDADLIEANLRSTDFTRANLSRAQLWDSNLMDSNLEEAILSEASLERANLTRATLRGANLCAANLKGALLIETDFTDADLTGCSVYGSAVWGITGTPRKQESLIITPEDEPTIMVDDLQVAQFIYLLLNHENLRQVLNSVMERGVLILGRFGGGGIEVLHAVAEKLREMKYLPMIFDFERQRDRTYTEIIKTLVGLSRFVVVDLSGPSVPQELYATVPHFKIPFVPILEKGRRPYAMFADILEYDWVIKPVVEFDTAPTLIQLLPSKIVEPAEKRHEKRQRLLREIYDR
jgi:uncharacterized protein YjbI with pentapeptide repeats